MRNEVFLDVAMRNGTVEFEEIPHISACLPLLKLLLVKGAESAELNFLRDAFSLSELRFLGFIDFRILILGFWIPT